MSAHATPLRILFTSAQVGSHLGWGGYLPTAAALVAAGHSVLWVSGAEVAQTVEAQGVPFRAVSTTGWRWPPPPPLDPAQFSPADYQSQRQQRALDQWLAPDRVVQAVDELDAVARDFAPHVIVGEMFMAAAALVAERRGCPLVVAGWPAPRDDPRATAEADAAGLVTAARTRLDTVLAATELQGDNWTHHGPPALCSPHLHISYWSPTWFRGVGQDEAASTLPAHGAQTVHVGGAASAAKSPDASLPDPADRPWVLITLGTSFNRDVAFFQMAARAVDELGGLPILALGDDLSADWVQPLRAELPASLPASAQVRAWIDFDAVLPYCAAAIQHGGAGTTHALITHAVPQIVVPHAADQMRQAQGVARTQIGMAVMPQKITAAALVQLLAQLLPDRAPARTHASALQQEFAALGGPSAAADQIVNVANH